MKTKKPIKLHWKRMEPLGFKYAGVFIPKPHDTDLFYKKHGLGVIFVHANAYPVTIGAFLLTPKQAREFAKGNLSLVPPGCCNPTGRASIEGAITVWSGDVPTDEYLQSILDGVVKLIDNHTEEHKKRVEQLRKQLREIA